MEECWRRFRSGLMVGYGQVLRLSLGTTLFWSHARALSRFMITLAFLALGVVLLVVAALSGARGVRARLARPRRVGGRALHDPSAEHQETRQRARRVDAGRALHRVGVRPRRPADAE
jgi:hypothetical protein